MSPLGLRLATGDHLDLPSPVATGSKVTLTVRPEQIRLVPPDETGAIGAGAIRATVTNLVYFGTDTHCRVALSDGSEMVIRLQSPATGEISLGGAGLVIGQKVGLRLAPGAAQVLED